ncbi:nuclease-related domain-containing protein [Filobacillus milosensis]|nr:nuclease-related domain-containing protein [Filobacillus milosensis]
MNKPHEPPTKLLKMLTLNRNIADLTKIPDFNDDIASFSSGYKGELSIDHDLNYILDDHFRLHNLRLPINDWHFEIDTLLILKNFFLILEIKNLKDIIMIDHEKGIMTQHTNGEIRTYQDPILQVEKQARQLDYWLTQRGYTIPIETLVVFVNKNVHLKDNHHERVIYPFRLSHKYYEFKEKLQYLPSIPTQELSQMLINSHERHNPDFLEKYNLKEEDFLPGYLCEKCGQKTIHRMGYAWKCSPCNFIDRQAPLNRLKERYLLFGPEITARQASEWLQVPVPTAGFMLRNYGFTKVGKKKGTKYNMEFDHSTAFQFLLDYSDQLYKRKLDESFRD